VAPRAEIASASPEETQDAGERLGRALGPGAVVALTGELGVSVRATSPTFVLINQYRGRVPVYHVDAYRTDSLTELMDLGLLELLGGGGVTVIEWADKLPSLLPSEAIRVHIDGVGDEPRVITIRT